MSEIKVGDRVRVKKSAICGFVQPWRKRFEGGRTGTVISGPSANIRGFLVEWDHRKTKYDYEWRTVMSSGDLIVMPETDPQETDNG